MKILRLIPLMFLTACSTTPKLTLRPQQPPSAADNVEHLRSLIEDRYLVHESLTTSRVREIRDQMDRAQARKLQPHYVGSFFDEAFKMFGGQLLKREPRRFEIRRVPAEIRLRDRIIGNRAPVLNAYERVTFHKSDVRLDGNPRIASLESNGMTPTDISASGRLMGKMFRCRWLIVRVYLSQISSPWLGAGTLISPARRCTSLQERTRVLYAMASGDHLRRSQIV
jgi:hypothetical protein